MSMVPSSDAASRLLKYTLSTITAPSFFQVVVVYLRYDSYGLGHRVRSGVPISREPSQVEIAVESPCHRGPFRVLREAQKVRDFRLVLSAELWGPAMEYAV